MKQERKCKKNNIKDRRPNVISKRYVTIFGEGYGDRYGKKQYLKRKMTKNPPRRLWEILKQQIQEVVMKSKGRIQSETYVYQAG